MKLRFRKRNKQHPYWADGAVSEGIYASCKCTCSCWMCGNPRKYFGKVTIEEQSQNEIGEITNEKVNLET